ncbi:MAG: hypothetical protein U1U88_001816 [Lawsonella clevelandensis]
MTTSYLSPPPPTSVSSAGSPEARRPFPWRDPHTSAWGVLVSEVMSQQTPMTRVEPIWRDWMERWPHPSDLGKEPVAEVVRAWEN